MLTALIYVVIIAGVGTALFFLASAIFGRGEELPPLPPGTTLTQLPVDDISGDDIRALAVSAGGAGLQSERSRLGTRSACRRDRLAARTAPGSDRGPRYPRVRVPMTVAAPGPDGRMRCPWALGSPEYIEYHDVEWGQPLHGVDAMFERLCLEAFQSGLSWITILRKREAFRKAFAGFDVAKVAAFDDADVERLLADPGIVRNRAKVAACVHNARVVATLDEPLDELIWKFAPAARLRPEVTSVVPAVTDESVALARELKRRGFKFIGPTTAYALMQATGMVDDHLRGCWVPTRIAT